MSPNKGSGNLPQILLFAIFAFSVVNTNDLKQFCRGPEFFCRKFFCHIAFAKGERSESNPYHPEKTRMQSKTISRFAASAVRHIPTTTSLTAISFPSQAILDETAHRVMVAREVEQKTRGRIAEDQANVQVNPDFEVTPRKIPHPQT